MGECESGKMRADRLRVGELRIRVKKKSPEKKKNIEKDDCLTITWFKKKIDKIILWNLLIQKIMKILYNLLDSNRVIYMKYLISTYFFVNNCKNSIIQKVSLYINPGNSRFFL